MKKFIKKTTLLVLLPIICYISFFAFLKFKLKNSISKSDAIIIGDSHTECLNIPNVYNYSINSSPYITHYNFLKSVEDKLQGKTVLIAFGYHNISSLYENRFNKNVTRTGWLTMVNLELNSTNFFTRSYNYNWQNNILDNIFSKNRIANLYHRSYGKPNINSTKFSTDTILFKQIVRKHYTNPDYINADIIQDKYLSLIIELLTRQNCQIFLINTPITEYYFNKIPVDIKNKHLYLVNKYKKAQYLDLNKILETNINSTIFKDADHVNQKGDDLIVEYIKNNIIKNNVQTHNVLDQ